MRPVARWLAAVAAGLFSLPAARAADPAKFTLNPGDHVCIVGNTLAERMQHDGHLEAALHARFPAHNLVIRNLGFSGDEITTRLRSMDFGTPDQWLAASAPVPQPTRMSSPDAASANRFANVGTKPDVIFAFFGYNESFAGEAGLPKFEKDLAAYLDHLAEQKFNGKSAPRVVVFSPIAHEDLKSPDLPDGKDNNKRLALYTDAMRKVAASKGVPFVDLFSNTKQVFDKLVALRDDLRNPRVGANPDVVPRLTINGVHLNDDGNRMVARVAERVLFGGDAELKLEFGDVKEEPRYAAIRAAVRDKNRLWFNRYRAVDGYSTFGERAFLQFTGRQSNYEVVQRELEVLDVMIANRDKVIWAAAQGKDAKPDDSNIPAFVPVSTNKPGKGPNGTHLFLSGEESIQAMTVGKGLKVNVFADETTFDGLLVNPMQMQFDTKGRLWVACWQTYPHWKPTEKMNDKLLVLEDTDGDGKADKCTVFADDLHNPTGFEFVPGGVLVAQCPDIMLLKDTDGDGKADVRERVLHGLDTADTHHASNSFVRDPSGAVYFQEGTFHHSQVESPYGPVRRNVNAGVYKYDPKTQKFDVYVTFGFANPHGHVFDRTGRDIVVDGTGAQPYDATLFSGYLPYPQKHARPPQVYQQRTRPCGGIEILSSSHFPESFRDNLVVTNCIGFQGILRYKLADSGGTVKGTELEPILSSTDPNFRPVDVKTGPDGALYFVDWHNPIIGHMQHNLRDPSRDRAHGRVYRVTHEGRELVKPRPNAGANVGELMHIAAYDPDNNVRARARLELAGGPTAEVIPVAKQYALGAEGRGFALGRIAALWVHQSHNAFDAEVLDNALNTSYRPAAIRVLAEWRHKVPDALDKLLKYAADPDPRVRLEAVRAASFFGDAEAVEVALVAGEQPADPAVAFAMGETLKALDPVVKAAIASKREMKFKTAAGARYFLRTVATDDLVKMTPTPAVSLELLSRPGVRDDARRAAAARVAAETKKPAWEVAADALKGQDRPGADESVTYDLARLLTARPEDLPAARPVLETLATTAKSDTLRQLALASLVAADGSPAKAWDLAKRSASGLRDFVGAVPAVRDPNQRAAAYPLVAGLLDKLPDGVTATAAKPVSGRFVRVELPGKLRTLTLAEVEVLSDGRNVALGKKCKQISTAFSGAANRAVDGNKSGNYGDGGQTHTRENETDPWWEVDLGGTVPVDAVVVYNRTDSNFNARLANFTVTVLSADRKPVFTKPGNTSADAMLRVPVGGDDPARAVRAGAMAALTTVRGKEADTFRLLAPKVAGPDRAAAVAALQRIPSGEWPKELAPGLVKQVTAAVAAVPAAEKTSAEVVDLMQFADALAAFLPRDDAKAARKALGEIGVRVIRVGTLTDQMLFDKDRIVVQAGKPVEFAVANTDLMPHNFVVTRMGALAEVGEAAEAFGTQPGAQEKNFVPPSDKVLLASRLLQPGQSQALRFQAPASPGVYPYVCTYPGHWRRMHGALYVVADLDEYLADPAGYVAKNPVPVADELLKLNRPRTEWTTADLAPAVKELDAGGRSLAHGKQLFAVATCVGCHKFDGQGQEFGPNLAALDKAVFKGPEDVLRHILEPSLRIEDKYRSYTFNLASGGTVTGMVLEKTPAGDFKVIENPLAKAEARLVKKDDLDGDPKAAPTSIMPKGLLDKLTKDEVLDLLAYVTAGANAKHHYFQGGGHDHHGHAAPAGAAPHAAHDHAAHADAPAAADPWVSYPGGAGVGAGKHVVLVSGDEEYRSEEALPMLAKLLSERHGFKTTVLFAVDPKDGKVQPNVTTNIPGTEQLASADLLVLFTRMRNLPDAQMKPFADYFAAGKPVVALRTATHAFATSAPAFKKWGWTSKEKGFEGGFGRAVLGETWVAHHGAHGKEGTRGVVTPGQEASPILRGVAPGSVFGTTDVYTAKPPADATVVLLGEVTETLKPDSKAVAGKKNAPMMPVAWTKPYQWDGGKPGKAFTTTLGASQDLAFDGTRRLVVNGCLWAVGLDVPADANVSPVGDYKPTPFGFKKNEAWKPGKAPAEYR